MSKYVFGKGITITTNFDVSTALPLDSRTVVDTLDDLAKMSSDIKHEGLLVFVISENKLYQWKKSLGDDGVLSEDYSWGPIEAEVSARDFVSYEELNFDEMQTLVMQKNKQDFFPVTHDNSVYVDKDGNTLINKYQTRVDENLETEDKTVIGSVNEINKKMETAIAEFREQIESVLAELENNVKEMQEEITQEMKDFKESTEAEFDAITKELENKMAAIEKLMNDMLADMEKQFADKMAYINEQMDLLQSQINDRIDQMLKDLDNSILSDEDVSDLLRQIQENLASLNEI